MSDSGEDDQKYCLLFDYQKNIPLQLFLFSVCVIHHYPPYQLKTQVRKIHCYCNDFD